MTAPGYRLEPTDEQVTAAMRAFEPLARRLLRYPEAERWHVNDVQGMREALRAAFAIAPKPELPAIPQTDKIDARKFAEFTLKDFRQTYGSLAKNEAAVTPKPVVRLYARLEDDGLVADVSVLDGSNLQARKEPYELYLGPPQIEPPKDVLIDVCANLAAAISLLERGGKKAAPSNKMFDQMLADYRASLERGRAALQEPESA